MLYIYVLQLQNNKFYIGKTSNPYFRFDNHFAHNGSEWTKQHKPINILELIPNCDDYDEDKYTYKYMDKYGIDNVRKPTFAGIGSRRMAARSSPYFSRQIRTASRS